MEEELISFEAAKLAKEKGFNEITNTYYHPNYGLRDEIDSCFDLYNADDWAEGYYSAPTQSLLQRWLREVHGLNISIALSGAVETTWFWSINDKEYQDDNSKAYEQALEAGLLEALKLIKYEQET